METQEGLDKRIEKLDLYQQKSTKSYYLFFRNITTISLGFLALFVSFKPDVINNEIAKYLFVSTTLLFGLCILFSLITQYGEVSLYRKATNARAKILQEYKESSGAKSSQAILVKPNKFYEIFEKGTYVCLGLSILSLVSYVYFLVIN